MKTFIYIALSTLAAFLVLVIVDLATPDEAPRRPATQSAPAEPPLPTFKVQ